LDSAINKLFASNLEEDQSAEGDIRYWGNGLTVEFKIPRSEGSLSDPVTIGTWTVTFDSPRPSIFSDIQLGINAHINLDLGVAAVETARVQNQTIQDIHNDFNSINAI